MASYADIPYYSITTGGPGYVNVTGTLNGTVTTPQGHKVIVALPIDTRWECVYCKRSNPQEKENCLGCGARRMTEK